MKTASLLFASCLIAGCSNSTTQSPPGEVGADGGNGTFTLSGSWHLNAGEERYQCFIVHTTDALRIRRIVPQAGQAVHHLGVFTDLVGTEKDGTRECAEMGIWGFVYGSGVGTGALTLPDGVAMPVDAATGVILQIHFLNATNQPIDSSTTVDLLLAGPNEVTQASGNALVGTTSITLPPHTTTNVDSKCNSHPLLSHVFAAFPHMHKLGASIVVTAGAGGTQPVVNLPSWNFGNQAMIDIQPAIQLDQDTPIQTRCSYDNTTDQTVQFGLHTSNEMCVVVLYYWPQMAGTGGLNICDQ
jgi:hypothetical protein